MKRFPISTHTTTRILLGALTAVGLFAFAAPASAATAYPMGTVNLRSGPGTQHTIITTISDGESATVLDHVGDWLKVRTPAGVVGYMADWVTRVAEDPVVPATTPPPAGEPGLPGLVKDVQAVRATGLYNGRSPEYDWLGSVRAWEHLTYLDSAEGWMKVATADGTQGWIDGSRVLLTDKNLDFSRRALYGAREGDWSMTYLKVREVVPGGTGLALRSGPSATAGVLSTLAQGAPMKLLQIPAGEYVQAMLADGTTGWVSRNWIKPVAPLPEESVRLSQVSRGVLRLEVTGQAAGVKAEGGLLSVALPANAARGAYLEVGQFGVTDMAFTPDGLSVGFEGEVRHQVVSQAGGTLVLEIRPVVEQVQRAAAADREIYRLTMGGTVEPVIRREGAYVALDLFGARLAPGLTLPDGVSVAADGGGVTLRVLSSKAFAVKRRDDFLDLELLSPGLIGKTVVVDPGHGGIETGAIGPTGLMEKNVNLTIGLKLKTLLEAAGAKVVMIRTADTRCATPEQLAPYPTLDEKLRADLGCRANTSDTAGADAFLSIHNNASGDRAVRGTETYWSQDNLNAPRSQVFAGLVQEEMLKSLGLRNLGVKENIFYVTRYTDAPAVLAEVAFLSNSTDEALLRQDSFLTKTAEALYRATARLWN
ncbi:MAG: putative N-acetylmuramoyl-L-alanine amidase [Symbiobacteriaceae bacterium]|jgi:N-acetylmuramoyl-L-alanine amidase|nr:putative N-acetylmuramoyl-L-alanine amidase [Symbiobacteriaceae bacterium]